MTVALLLGGAVFVTLPRAALAAPCKADGEVCRTSQSCCGTSGNNCVCVKEGSAKFGVCCTPSSPSTEVCDGLDNDCNGLVDDGSAQTSCQDTNACTIDEACTTDTCDSGTGRVRTPVDCDDDDACTTDTYDPATGCAVTPVTCATGLHCGDTSQCVPDAVCPCFNASDLDLLVQTCGDRGQTVGCID